MYWQLGSTVFEGLFAPHEFKKKTATDYAEVKLISSKPDLQMVGLELDEIKLNIRLHADFCDPTLRYNDLEFSRINGEVLPFVDGYGNIIGNFVITELEQNVVQTDPMGAVYVCECDIQLKEYVDPNRAISKSIAAKNNAFALSATTSALKIQSPVLDPSLDVFNSTRDVNLSSSLASQNIAKAAVNPDAAASYLDQARNNAMDLIRDVNKLQQKVEDYQTGVANAVQLRNTITQAKANSVALLEAIASGNVAIASTSLSLFGASLQQVNLASLPLNKDVILR